MYIMGDFISQFQAMIARWRQASLGFCNFLSGSASDRLIAITQALYFPLYLGICMVALTAKSMNRTGI